MSRDDARRTLVAYDIPDDRRRTRLSTKLAKYGDRLQYSVFVVDASPAKLLRMKSEIEEVLDLQKDSVLFCDLGRLAELSEARFSFLGQGREVTSDEVFVF
ncbi:CRISPR-associated endonuclease Cas2 [Corynebacterium gerontici]|uniref:CRISPR-associated endoribonuclease Cas2 n=1 Tax=Corynebacterium gerontici TaxID=2079234 RepID=A0A3G6J276_9CORY|nr:CRISPR-associated endonuclease Cas2 [Corynebacterium gerontici]AZA10490.1 CRISPR-associated endoribonuclease Cas2 [Corynebacterium gerontici]